MESHKEVNNINYRRIAQADYKGKQRNLIDELYLLNENLMKIENRYKSIQELGHVGNWELDLSNNRIWASEEAFRLYGLEYESPYIPFDKAHEIVHQRDRARLDNALKLLIQNNHKYDIEYTVINHATGSERIIHSLAKLEFDHNRNPIKVLGVLQDITEYRINEDLIKHFIYYDVLTNLPNKTLFISKLNEAIEHAHNTDSKLAVVILDIDNFKKINDAYGYNDGDQLIVKVAERIKALLYDYSSLARLEGDEFAFLIHSVENIDDIYFYLNKLKDSLTSPFNINRNVIRVSFSFGVALYPEDNDNSLEMLKNAEIAVYEAKKVSNNKCQFYSKSISDEIVHRLNIERCLHDAIINNELMLHYQPQIDMKTNTMRGFEALLRFNSKELGIISPIEFISIAEETGLIIPIGEWVLRTACKANVNWCNEYKSNCIVSINISAVQLAQEDFVDLVKNILDETELDPELLELEITESVLIKSFDRTIDILETLKGVGIKIAIDDFGTGYSSLNYISKLFFNTLKIDKAFVQDIKKGSREELITSTIISFAHSLGFEVVAEGIETKDQLEFLVKSDCDHLQGFLLSKPIDEKEMSRIISNGCSELLTSL